MYIEWVEIRTRLRKVKSRIMEMFEPELHIMLLYYVILCCYYIMLLFFKRQHTKFSSNQGLLIKLAI